PNRPWPKTTSARPSLPSDTSTTLSHVPTDSPRNDHGPKTLNSLRSPRQAVSHRIYSIENPSRFKHNKRVLRIAPSSRPLRRSALTGGRNFAPSSSRTTCNHHSMPTHRTLLYGKQPIARSRGLQHGPVPAPSGRCAG
ncbi:unnamed protein product, partial [Ectocarpus sp. 13 AM-2016]